MLPPDIASSTPDERKAFVSRQWECMNHCPSCGKCHFLRGRDALQLYADYIEGRRSYLELTLEIRNSL